MASNLITAALSDRQLNGDKDTVPFLNKEAIPLLRQIRTALNGTPIALSHARDAAIASPVDLATALTAIDAIRQVLIDFGLTE